MWQWWDSVKFRAAYRLSKSCKYTVNKEPESGLNALGQCFAILCCGTCDEEEDSLSMMSVGHMEAVKKLDFSDFRRFVENLYRINQ